MATDTKEFDVIRVCRSDGVDTGPGYWPVTAPVASPVAALGKKQALDKAPRARPQMTRLPEDDPRYTEWRVKLGILLKQELSPHPEGEDRPMSVSAGGRPSNLLITRWQRLVCSISQGVLVVREV